MKKSEKFEARWLRILACTGAKNDSALARVLGILPQSVTAARKRAQIPTGWIENISEQYGVSTDWLFFGRGPMRLSAASEQNQDEAQNAARTPEAVLQAACPHCAKLEAKLEISEEERRELSAENRRLYQEKSILERENGELREKVARLEERKRRHDLTHGIASEDSGVA